LEKFEPVDPTQEKDGAMKAKRVHSEFLHIIRKNPEGSVSVVIPSLS
jgi:hypothetical protein